MLIEKLSASRLGVYKDCPFRYFLQYHIKLDEFGDTIATHKGSAVHEALELHVRGEDYEKVLKDYYAKHKVWEFDDRRPGKGFAHPVEKECDTCQWAIDQKKGTMCSVAQRFISDFDGCPKPNFEDDLKLTQATINAEDSVLNRKILGAEVPFDMEFEGFNVRGYIDLITEINEDTIEVIDYKTGNYTKGGKEAFQDFQMRIYSMVAKKIYPQYKYVLMTLYYLRKRPITVTFSKEDDKKTEEFLRTAYRKIAESVDPPRKKSFKCTWCVGYDRCGEIRQNYMDENGKFIMPPPVIKEKKPRLLPLAPEEIEPDA